MRSADPDEPPPTKYADPTSHDGACRMEMSGLWQRQRAMEPLLLMCPHPLTAGGRGMKPDRYGLYDEALNDDLSGVADLVIVAGICAVALVICATICAVAMIWWMM